MSNDPKPTPPKSDAPKSIPVKVLQFFQPHPSFRAQSQIAAEPADNKTKVSIEFIPSLRHHRVEVSAPSAPMRTYMICEALVASWEPLA